MRHWLIRCDTQKIRPSPDRQTLTFWSKRQPRIAEGDRVVLVYAGVFKETCSVAEVSRPDVSGGQESIDFGELSPSIIDGEPSWSRTQVRLTKPEPLPEGLAFEVMQFSLTIVRNLKAPSRNLSRSYRLLPEVDYHTLMDGEPFVARTAYLHLLHALPPILQIKFEMQEMLAAVVLQTGARRSNRGRLERLLSFIDSRVLTAGRLLGSISEQASHLDRLIGSEWPIQHLFLGADDTDDPNASMASADSLAEQVRRFNSLNETFKRPSSEKPDANLFDDLLAQIDLPDKKQIETRFEAIFGVTS